LRALPRCAYFSTPARAQTCWLNLLVLNFPYHSAHHVRPGVLAENYGSVSASGDRAGEFWGAIGVSFLTAV
jgi:fatty acid desaturase